MIIARLLHWPSALVRSLDPWVFYSTMSSPGGTSLHTLPLASCEGAAFGAALMIRLHGEVVELRADASKEGRPPQIRDWSGCILWEIAYSCVPSYLTACGVVGLGRLQAEAMFSCKCSVDYLVCLKCSKPPALHCRKCPATLAGPAAGP